jgi:hypothetical protein
MANGYQEMWGVPVSRHTEWRWHIILEGEVRGRLGVTPSETLANTLTARLLRVVS